MFQTPQKTVTFSVVGENTGEVFEGQFTFKILLNLQEFHDKELLYTQLLGDISNPTRQLESLAYIRSNLKYHIVDAPMWWKESRNGSDLFDFNVLTQLQAHLNDSIIEHQENNKKRAAEKN